MLFISPIFLIYFLPIFLWLYHVSKDSYKNYLILCASLIFYAWGAPKFVFVLLLTTAIDFSLVKIMSQKTELKSRKLFLILSVALNIGLLVYFKYMNFFVNNFKEAFHALGLEMGPMLNIVLPIGISFFVFESITYAVDVYRKEQEPLKNFSYYLLYIFFFPKMIAGPIVRYGEIAAQIEGRFKESNVELYVQGFGRFVTGLAKKVMIADVLGVYTDAYIRNISMGMDMYSSWLCAIAFSMQIYFDFSAYSDMAIGIANMLGFRLNENFNNPFTSSRLKEFWQRWHMSFTRWIKSYVYIPLGGSKISTKRTYLNLWIIFIISGLWHGAAWNYLIWGCVHGLFLILEKIFLGKLFDKMGRWASTIIIFIFIILSTLLLKSKDLSASLNWYGSLFGFSAGNTQLKMLTETKLMLVLAIFFSIFTILPYGQKIQNWWYGYNPPQKFPLPKLVVYVLLWIISLSYVSGHQFKSFLYYMF